MAKVIHTSESDSKGYTRYFLDEPVGTASGGVVLRGKEIKLAEARMVPDENNNIINQDKAPFEITLHGQREFDVPNEITELTIGDGGDTLKLSHSGN